MGFASRKYEKKREERPWKIHPVWRGIGCLLIILIPIMSWVGAQLFLKSNHWIRLPEVLIKPIMVPYTTQSQVDPVILFFNRIFNGITYGNIFFFFVFLFLGFGILSILYAMIYRVVGPPRYTQFDARNVRPIKRRRY